MIQSVCTFLIDFHCCCGFLTCIKSMAPNNGLTLGPHKLHHDYRGLENLDFIC